MYYIQYVGTSNHNNHLFAWLDMKSEVGMEYFLVIIM